MIKSISITNVKGIGNGGNSKKFDLNIIPNKPSLLIAPNGFGKSSFATAFDSMNRDRIKLDKKAYHLDDEANKPILVLEWDNGTTHLLRADDTSNTITDHFDVFVICNKLRAKGVGQSFSGRTNVSASLGVDPIVLIDSIPQRQLVEYKVAEFRNEFGVNGKVMPNLTNLLNNGNFLSELLENSEIIESLNRTENTRENHAVTTFLTRLNTQEADSTKSFLIKYIIDHEMPQLRNTNYFKKIAQFIMGFDFGFGATAEVDSYLAAIQLSKIYLRNKDLFKAHCKFRSYDTLKNAYRELFATFNTSRIEMKPVESNGALILKFPSAHQISNGQRDVLVFIALLEKAKLRLRKSNCILVIDEIFDYLDDANLIAVQYYIGQFIDDFKSSDRKLYPLILSHLDPDHFKGFVFGRKHALKVYYLAKATADVNQHLIKLLKERNKATSPIKEDIEKYLLHFHSSKIARRNEFKTAMLPETWGDGGDTFVGYITSEAAKYCADTLSFDPLAVCCALRVRIEKNVFELISDTAVQRHFLDVENSGTMGKLIYASEKGIDVPEIYFLLGIVYNEALHWQDSRDENANISPALGKLQNLTIKQLVKSVFR